MDNKNQESLSISKEQIKSLYSTFRDLTVSYKEKDLATSDQDWLADQYKAACPSLTNKEALELGKATVNGVSRFQATLQEAIESAASGKSKEQWFAEKMAQETESLTPNECSNYVHALNQAVLSGNSQMMANDAIQISGDTLNMPAPEIIDTLPSSDEQWNPLTLKDAFLNLGQNGALTGLQTMMQADSYGFSSEALKDVPNISDDIESTIDSGQTEQLKTLLTAAVKIGVDSGKLPFLPKAAPVESIASITCNGVEYISTLSRFSKGQITLMQAMNRVGLSGVSTLYTLFSGEGLGHISAALVWHIPIVGPVLANVVGALVTAAVGGKIREKVHQTIKKVENTVRTAVNTAWNAIKATGQKIKNTVKNFCSWLFA